MAVPVSSATPIVFLDIDGVLLPFGHADPLHRAAGNQDDFPDECLGALARILEAVPNARLVLSSTWRCWPGGVGHICGEFRRHGGALKDVRFLSMTNKENHSHRQWEIAEWLRGDEGRAVDTWVALDDEELLDGAPLRRHRAWFANHVVKTRSDVGLTAELADRAIALLRAAPVPRPTEAEEAAAAGAADPLAPFTLRSIAGRPRAGPRYGCCNGGRAARRLREWRRAGRGVLGDFVAVPRRARRVRRVDFARRRPP